MQSTYRELFEITRDFYKEIESSGNYSSHMEDNEIKMSVDRGVLEKIWEESKSDMMQGLETIGIVNGCLEKINEGGKKFFHYRITSADRLQRGMTEEEIEDRVGCLAVLIGGMADAEVALPFLDNNTGIYHTHPVINSIGWGGLHKERVVIGRDIELPARPSGVDGRNMLSMTSRARKAKGYDVAMLPFVVATSYAEAKVVWDIIFQSILPRYTGIKDTKEIKREVFEIDFGRKVMNESISAHGMQNDLKSFYEAASKKDYKKIVTTANSFVKTLNERGYTSETKLLGPDSNVICQWIENPLLWQLAKEDAINTGILARYDLQIVGPDRNFEFQFPYHMYREPGKQIGYFNAIRNSQEADEFRQVYRKKFGKEFTGLATQYANSDDRVVNGLPEVCEVFSDNTYLFMEFMINRSLKSK